MPEARITKLQQQARALGDPTRHDIFRYVVDARRPVDVAELTERFGLHHNAIRQHLAKLVSAALVTEDRAPSTGRGRPRLIYQLDPAAESRWGVIGPYERLSVLLAEILRTGDSPAEVGRRSVRRLQLGAADDDDPVNVVVDAMERQGFEPALGRARGDRVEVVLRTCPFQSAALADPDTVCGIHLGIAEGVASLTGRGVIVDELVPHDPRRANCRLRMHLTPVENHPSEVRR
ncbi:MAG: helix-turn-helix transcriptional regulator [Acidimicrobiia bacterium]